MTKDITENAAATSTSNAQQHTTDNMDTTKKAAAKKAAAAHKSPLSEEIIKYAKLYNFSHREAEVLGEIFKGLAIREIAEALYITERTVKYHISNILSKTNCKNQRTLLIKLKCNE